MEELFVTQKLDRTSLGIFRPKEILDLVAKPAEGEWKPGFKAALMQRRLWENRRASKEPPRKIPFKFQYKFSCDDSSCKGHQTMIEDWEVGALYWKCVDAGGTPQEACRMVKQTFLNRICSPDRDLHFYVGTILAHPRTWVIIGTYWPKKEVPLRQSSLF
jgi:hypothetical protein